jgi:hypothetical protein
VHRGITPQESRRPQEALALATSTALQLAAGSRIRRTVSSPYAPRPPPSVTPFAVRARPPTVGPRRARWVPSRVGRPGATGWLGAMCWPPRSATSPTDVQALLIVCLAWRSRGHPVAVSTMSHACSARLLSTVGWQNRSLWARPRVSSSTTEGFTVGRNRAPVGQPLQSEDVVDLPLVGRQAGPYQLATAKEQAIVSNVSYYMHPPGISRSAILSEASFPTPI